MDRPITRADITHYSHWLALGFGSGLMRKAPGTWGSLAGLVLFWPLLALPVWAYAALLLVAAAAGIPICGRAARDWGVHDHGAIVWDEVVGIGIVLLVVPATLSGAVVAFALFRLFDIWKPWPISVLDHSVHGGLGIMLDDLLAGVFAAVAALVVFHFLPVAGS